MACTIAGLPGNVALARAPAADYEIERMSHAIVVRQHGGPEVLRWEPIEVGAPPPGHIRVAHRAIGVNYLDVYHRTGLYPEPLPLVPGVEAAGVIEAVGAGVSELAVGDRVAYVGGPLGAYSERRLLPAARALRLPADVADETAAAGLLRGMTAYVLLRRVYAVRPGVTIVVHAAAGGTGLIICQWARSLGATVIGVVSSDDKAALAARHGCHHVVVSTREDLAARVLALTDGHKVPVVYDSVGRDTFAASLDCLARGGLLVSYGQSSGPVPPVEVRLLAQKGSLALTRPSLFHFIAERRELVAAAGELFAAIAAGAVRIVVNQRHPLREAALAHRDLEARRTTGSTVLVTGLPHSTQEDR